MKSLKKRVHAMGMQSLLKNFIAHFEDMEKR